MPPTQSTRAPWNRNSETEKASGIMARVKTGVVPEAGAALNMGKKRSASRAEGKSNQRSTGKYEEVRG